MVEHLTRKEVKTLADRHAEFDNLLDLTLNDGVIDMECWVNFITQSLGEYYREATIAGRLGLNGNRYEDFRRDTWK